MDDSGRQGETARNWGDYRDRGDQSIQMDNSRRLRKTARDWGDCRLNGAQDIWGARVDDSGRLG